jgi:dipeptidyl aminopeptidase
MSFMSSFISYFSQCPVSSNDLEPIRVTTSGNASLFHGVPDWVYEEEVFASDHTLWWSPDSSKIAFLALDETAVPEFSFPIYNPTDSNDAIIPYTHDMVMKYPKPGYPNPLVSAHVFDLRGYLARGSTSDTAAAESTTTLDWDGRHPSNDSIIQDVTWVGDTTLILKEVNRNADDGSVVLFELSTNLLGDRGRVVRKLGKHGEQGDDGWIDHVGYFLFAVSDGI